MNKKGFTLIELLAVIIILALLALLANSSVTNVISNSKSDLYNAQIKLIETAAQNWGVDNLNKLPESGTCSYIILKDLKDYGMFEKEVINPKTNEEFSDDLVIKITSKTNDKGELVSNYEISPSNIKNCTYAYPPVCTLVNDADSSATITAGDVYNCKVKEEMEAEYPSGYTFYVLTTPNEKDNHVDFIMNQNINSDGTPAGMTEIEQNGDNVYNLVAWINKEDYESVGGTKWNDSVDRNLFGPITAMNFLAEATKTWTNTNEIKTSTITYENGNTYTMPKIYYSNARMPIYSSNASKTEVAHKTELNEYLYDNLRTDNVGPYGYWTFSPCVDYRSAWRVGNNGFVNDIFVYNNIGVRPVITIPKRLISN